MRLFEETRPDHATDWEAMTKVAQLLQVEMWCSDRDEHRRRVEARTADMPGQQLPSWDHVESQQWSPWDEERDGPRTLIEATDSRAALAALLAVTRAS